MDNNFEDKLKDSKQSAIFDLAYKNKPLLIAFGGMAGGLAIPPFEFFKLVNNLCINKIFIRDLGQAWYHAGIPEISNTIDETAAFLKQAIVASNPEKVIVIGTSMGGYAAILFGALLDADIVHAFSPQTTLEIPEIIRSKVRFRCLNKRFSGKYFDLKDTLKKHHYSCVIRIYYDSED